MGQMFPPYFAGIVGLNLDSEPLQAELNQQRQDRITDVAQVRGWSET